MGGKAILYADRITDSMRVAIGETERRRQKQVTYNQAHGITPRSIIKAVKNIIEDVPETKYAPAGHTPREALQAAEEAAQYEAMAPGALAKLLARLEKEMYQHARNLEFEKAAQVRDKIRAIETGRFGLVARKTG